MGIKPFFMYLFIQRTWITKDSAIRFQGGRLVARNLRWLAFYRNFANQIKGEKPSIIIATAYRSVYQVNFILILISILRKVYTLHGNYLFREIGFTPCLKKYECVLTLIQSFD